MSVSEELPLPDDPALAAVARAMIEAGQWGVIVDAQWGFAFATREFRFSMGGSVELAPMPPLGAHYFGPEANEARRGMRTGPREPRYMRPDFVRLGGLMLADTPGGHDELRRRVDPAFSDLVDGLGPAQDDFVALGFRSGGVGLRGTETEVTSTILRVREASGRLAGTALLMKPAIGMALLANLASAGDPEHFARMQTVARAARRPAAVLFADLEGSSPLARRLPTAGYFALGRRLVREADRCVVAAGGIVGRHVGDGVTALFLAETAGSESTAARACIEAARALRAATAQVADREGLAEEEIVLRFGLHWGATIYVGQVLTSGRAEVTALGDEVNEAARIEACATGGRALASKALVERLGDSDAEALGLQLGAIAYTPLGDLPTATEKARRDAPAIAVCDV